MNDEMDALRAMLTRPGPSPDAIETGRRQLELAIRGQVRRRRATWQRLPGQLVIGAATATAAAVAAAVVVPGLAAHTGTSGGSPGTVRPSARQILLAAAKSAAANPEGQGTYWYVKETYQYSGGRITQQTWTTRSGAIWVLDPSGTGVWQMGYGSGFSAGGSLLTFAQLQALPANPAALKAWIVRSFSHPSGGVPPSRIPASAMLDTIAGALSNLLYEVPAPPLVRAAAFRELASLPDVRSLGAVAGGQELVISGTDSHERRLVIDPATSMVRSATEDGKTETTETTETIVTEKWTNAIPKVIQLPQKNAKNAPKG